MTELIVDDEIHLRVLGVQHAELLFALVDSNRGHLRQWLPWLDTNLAVTDTLAFLEAVEIQRAENGEYVAGIWYRDGLVGVVGHNRIDWENRTSNLGYWLAADCEGKGVMTRSCRALIDHAFDHLGLSVVVIRCATENRKSRAIPERLGFQQQSTDKNAEWLYDHFVDLIVYQMRISEWRG